MKELNLFKFQYAWYEGEFCSYILATTKDKKEIEKDLKEAVKKAKIKRGDVDCLPLKYRRIIDFLIKKGYIICNFIDDPTYDVDDDEYLKKQNKIINIYKIENKETKTTRRKL